MKEKIGLIISKVRVNIEKKHVTKTDLGRGITYIGYMSNNMEFLGIAIFKPIAMSNALFKRPEFEEKECVLGKEDIVNAIMPRFSGI